MTQRYPTKAEREAAEPPLPRDRLWTDREAAAYLGVHPVTLVVWRNKDKGPPFVRPNGDVRLVRYFPDDVTDWLKANRHDTNPATAARPEGQRRAAAH